MGKHWLVFFTGDIIALLAFVLAGRSEHGLTFHALEILTTASPFLVGWLIGAALTRLYRKETADRLTTTVKKTLLVLFIAVPIGLILRSFVTGNSITVTFAFVAFVFTTLFMLGWRTLYVWALHFFTAKSLTD